MGRKRLAPIADEIAAGINAMMVSGNEPPTWEQIRDECDMHTGCELDCQPLDVLADMVERRIQGKMRGDLRPS